MTREKRKEWEATVLSCLCAELPGSWRVENTERERPDGEILSPDGTRIGVEVVGYRAQTSANGSYEADGRLKGAFRKRWQDHADLQCFYPRWTYRTDHAGRPRVPRTNETGPFLDELVEVVQTYGPSTAEQEALVVLHETDGEMKVRQDGAGTRRLESGWWKTLSSFCSQVAILRGDTPLSTGRSSLNTGFVGFDGNQLATAVSKHVGKLPDYRASLPGSPIWLVIHSDGHPHNTLLLPHMQADAIDVVNEALAGTTSSFDAVFLLDQPSQYCGGDLRAIDTQSEAILDGSSPLTRPASR